MTHSAALARWGAKACELPYMTRDFWRILRGSDYFHYPDNPGRYFRDQRSYFVDFRHKAAWTGAYRDEVPVLFVPTLGRDVVFPGMVLQFGLGAIDRYIETMDRRYRDAALAVYRWLGAHVLSDGSFDNLVSLLHGRRRYVSSNSAMVQGEALSFLTRVIRLDLAPSEAHARALLTRVHHNCVLPIERGGTVRYEGEDVFLCEYCRTDGQVVLNGWIFGLFGLLDYTRMTESPHTTLLIDRSIATLERHLPGFIRPDGWSNYDNRGRIASPVYQHTHITLLSCLATLIGSETLHGAAEALRRGDTWWNRVRYTALKIRDRLVDPDAYTTAA
ncbi:MAG: hypothetical protein HYU37_12685 [Acidobacteria bacterium]|nr:hypothetical protein [Acidobacteriota bacterium]